MGNHNKFIFRTALRLQTKQVIYFLIFLSLVVRTFDLFSPIVGVQSWRQADTAAMARNFYEEDFNIFYPQIDWRGNTTGYVESEFPIYQFTIAALYKIFGVHESIGRLISIFFSIISIYLLYKVVLMLIDKKTALWAAFIYSVLPLNIFYSRVFMPEPMLIMSILSGIYFFIRWIGSQRLLHYALSLVFITIACLIKIPTLYIGLPIGFLAFQKYKWKVFIKPALLFYSFFVMLFLYLWYSHAHQIFLDTGLSFGIWGYGTDKWGNWDFIFTWEYINGVFFKNIAEKHLTWVGFIFCLIGLIKFFRYKEYRFFYSWIAAGLIYLVIVAKGNYFHDYYQLPIIIPITVFIGSAIAKYFDSSILSNYRKTLLYASLVVLFLLSGVRLIDYFGREDLSKNNKYILAENTLVLTKPGSIVIAVSSYDPMLLYNAHKKGWQSFPSELNEEYILEKKKLGAKYILGNNDDFTDSQFVYLRNDGLTFIYDDHKSFIIKID